MNKDILKDDSNQCLSHHLSRTLRALRVYLEDMEEIGVDIDYDMLSEIGNLHFYLELVNKGLNTFCITFMIISTCCFTQRFIAQSTTIKCAK